MKLREAPRAMVVILIAFISPGSRTQRFYSGNCASEMSPRFRGEPGFVRCQTDDRAEEPQTGLFANRRGAARCKFETS